LLCLLAAGWLLPQSLPHAQVLSSEPPLPPPRTSLPSLGTPESEDLPPLEEKRIVLEIRKELARAPENIDDPEVNGYLRDLARRLAAPLGLEAPTIEPFALRDPQLNAFAMPGGLMGVNSGLIVTASNENELAAVLAHEIGHVEQRHVARMLATQKQSSLWSLASLALAMLAVRANTTSGDNAAQAAMALGQGMQLNQMLAFSRDAEREADRVGLFLLTNTGYDVSGMVGIFQRLQAQGRLYESNGPVYQRTHPLTTERIADIQNRTRMIAPRPPLDSLDFRLAQARVAALAPTTTDGRREARQRLLSRLAGELPGESQPTAISRAASHYGLAVLDLIDAAPREAQSQVSLMQMELIRAGITDRTVHPSLMLLDARLQAALGQGDAALVTLAQVRTKFPESRLARDGVIDVMQSIGAHQRAVELLKARIAVEPDAAAWWLLAKSHAALDDKTSQLRAQAEALALEGTWPQAVQSLKTARLQPGLDFYTGSQIDARLIEFTARMKQEAAERKKRGDPPEDRLVQRFRAAG
jgi:predicted Zn-dependent protease